MQNIELKAKYENLESAENIARKIGAEFSATLRQIDTYFRVKTGRLKCREINSSECQLIFYTRPDEAVPKLSDYRIYPVDDPAAMKDILESALGSWCVVEKRRKLYLYDEVRIHLDSVTKLGDFIEFEGVLTPNVDKRATREKVNWLISQFHISPSDFVDRSYSDMMSDFP
ncbi:MAG: class IV adenylate cyclase [bacterium]